ncbi:MAG: hypothetical protein WC523_08035 [Patescibacteria group bacterium]
MKTDKTVTDGKLTDEQLGKLHKKLAEIIKRINDGLISYQDAIDVMQYIIIEGKAPLHLEIIKGKYELKLIEDWIDCNVTPHTPYNYTIKEHQTGGLIKFIPSQISLYASKEQAGYLTISGYELWEEVKKLPVLNANVLDYLWNNKNLIPEEWKDKIIYFWGTIYDSKDGPRVRCLEWNGLMWLEHTRRLSNCWSSGSFAVLAAAEELKLAINLIDCSAPPFCPEGLVRETHQGKDFFKFDPAKIYLHQPKTRGTIEELSRLPAGKLALNANVLDYLLKHPELIPKEWRGKYIFFFGTIYRGPGEMLFARYLVYRGSEWCCDYSWLSSPFSLKCFSALVVGS